MPAASTPWEFIDQFFMSTSNVHQTLRSIASKLTNQGIDYALIGGMALVVHGYIRTTQDIDLLMSVEGLQRFQAQLFKLGFVPAFAGATRMFRDSRTNVIVEVITAGEYPGDGKPKPVRFPDPATVAIDRDGIKVVNLSTLIELKLASGLSAPDRLKDLADVQELIRVLNLPISLSSDLDQSVRSEYLRLWRSILNR